jgi:hypothetical protein
MLDNPLAYLIFGLLFAWVASYFYSAWHNRRKLTWVARWLEESLPILGSKISSRFHGTDRLDILINEGRGIIKEAAIVVGVQSRRLFNALISVVKGGHDSMSFMVQLNRAPNPNFYFEIYGLKEPVPQLVMLTPEAWQIEDYPRAPYHIAFKTSVARESAFRLIALLHDLNLDIRRISIRSTMPQVFLVFNLTRQPQVEAGELLRIIRSLSEEVSAPQSKTKETSAPTKGKTKGKNPFFRPGIDTGLSANGRHSTNGHHPKD